MKKLVVSALALGLCCCACGDKKADNSNAPTDAPAAVDAPAVADAPAAANSDELAKLLEAVELSPKGLKELYKGKSSSEMTNLDKKLLTHSDEVVRVFVFERATRNYNETNDDLAGLITALKAEKSPKVIAAGIRSLSNNLKVNSDLYAFVKEAAKNEDAKVRAAAAFALANVNNKSVDGIFDEALKLLNDSDKDVRKAVCKELPRSENEAIIPEIVKILNSTEDKDVEIHGDCLDGLISMWYSAPVFNGGHSDAAYKASLDYLKKTPRTKKIPAWNGMSKLGYSADKKADWKAAASHINADEVVTIMTDIAKDTAADPNARKAAIKSIAAFGSKTNLEALDKVIEESDKQIKKVVAETMAKM